MSDPMENPDALFDLLGTWVTLGWIRELDLALPRFLTTQAEVNPDPVLVLAITLVSHQLGRGHVCLDLKAVLADPDNVLAIPPAQDAGMAHVHRPSGLLTGWTCDEWLTRLRSHQEVVASTDAMGNNPLVLSGHRLYLRRYWQYERQVEAAILQRMAHGPAASSSGMDALIRQNLDLLYPPAKPAEPGTDWQKVACALAARNAFSIITGGPGTGKTTTVVRLLALLQQVAADSGATRLLRIRLAAPTGKAAARLKESIAGAISKLPDAFWKNDFVIESIPRDVVTLHRLLGSRPDSRQFRHNAANPLPLDVLVVDECSMVDLEMMAATVQALPDHARLVLLGDKDQLASVEAGSVLGALCRQADHGHYHSATIAWIQSVTGQMIESCFQNDHGRQLDQHVVMLRKSYRFTSSSGIGQLAAAVNGDVDAKPIDDIRAAPPADLRFLKLQDLNHEAIYSGYADYLSVIREGHPDDDAESSAWEAWAARILAAQTGFQVLCALRQGPHGVEGLNRQIERLLKEAGLLPAIPGVPGSGSWFVGRPVMVTRNDYRLNLMNGDIGVTLLYPLGQEANGSSRLGLRVAFPKGDGSGGVRWVLPSRLTSVETVFAMTVHKSQGSEFTHCALLLPPDLNPVLTRELIYTGITRAKTHFTLISFDHEKTDILKEAMQRRVVRSGGLFEARTDR